MCQCFKNSGGFCIVRIFYYVHLYYFVVVEDAMFSPNTLKTLKLLHPGFYFPHGEKTLLSVICT